MKKYLTLLAASLIGCVSFAQPPDQPNPYNGLSFQANVTNGLSSQERQAYYYADEGIQYLPVDVLLSLDRPFPSGLGLYDERLLARPERFGLYPNPYSQVLPPIGITASEDKDYVSMAGIACSTCHTQLIAKDGKSFLVDGGSSLFAIDRFVKEMVFSIAYTALDPSQFNAFYDRYRARAKTHESKLHRDLKKRELKILRASSHYKRFTSALSDHLAGKNPAIDQDISSFVSHLNLTNTNNVSASKSNKPDGAYPTADQLDSELKMYGYLAGRLLFFYQQSKYAASNDKTVGDSGLSRSNPWNVVKNLLADRLKHQPESNWPKVTGGPINTPSIWRFDRSEWIFWEGVTNSMLERNMAQGLALLTSSSWTPGSESTTISIKKLHTVSAYASRITPPVWPEEILGKIDQAKATQGKEIYKNSCLGCHADSSKDQTASFSYRYLDVGTDPNYYLGQIEPFVGGNFFTDGLTPWLRTFKDAAYKNEGIQGQRDKYEAGRLNVIWKQPQSNAPAARPLYGVWATAPYLHNGSVLSIRELLKKPADRLTEFFIGSIEYNSNDLGFENVSSWYAFKLQTNCKTCTGNSNQGHDLGTNLSDLEKDQLIEFLKSYTVDTKFD